MKNRKENFTLLVIGDKIDFDSFMKFHKERNELRNSHIRYAHTTYSSVLREKVRKVRSKKILIFLFFPFEYWNKKIETKHYKGIYANHRFHKKFKMFWKLVEQKIRRQFKGKEIFFINHPNHAGSYRDKLLVKRILKKSKVPTPKLYDIKGVRGALNILQRSTNLFLKVRYGSMGKGITFLSKDKWLTNFNFRKNKIKGKKSDYGWRFNDVSKNKDFLKALLNDSIYAEKAVDLFVKGNRKMDLRIYCFMDKIIHIYPRTSDIENVITNISQGGRGERSSSLKLLPDHLIHKIKDISIMAARSLNLNFAGVDIILDRDLKNIYVNDVNVFPGFPKVKKFNLTKRLLKNIKTIDLQRTHRL